MTTRALVFGKNGQVAQALSLALPAHGIELISVSRPGCDMSNPEQVRAAVDEHRPDIVINPAAYTAVDKAEDEPELAYAINCIGAAAAAEAAFALEIPIIHFSTDYVFDGSKGTPYLETDPTAPLGAYGSSKLAGEEAIARANPRHVILRTAWVCSATGGNFVKTMLRVGADRDELRVVADQTGAPTFAIDIAEAVAKLVPSVVGASEGSDVFGTFHMMSEGEATWYDLACAIFEESGRHGGPTATVTPITTADYPTKAKRPAYSKLSTEKFRETFGLELPHWRQSLTPCVIQLLEAS